MVRKASRKQSGLQGLAFAHVTGYWSCVQGVASSAHATSARRLVASKASSSSLFQRIRLPIEFPAGRLKLDPLASVHRARPTRVLTSQRRRHWVVSTDDGFQNQGDASSSSPSISDRVQEQRKKRTEGRQSLTASADGKVSEYRGVVAAIGQRSKQLLSRFWLSLRGLLVVYGPMLRRYAAEYAWFMLILGVRLLVLMMTALLSPIIFAFIRLFPRWRQGALWTEPRWPRRVCFIGDATSPLLRQIALEVYSAGSHPHKINESDGEATSSVSHICWVDSQLDALEDARASCAAVAPNGHFRLLHLADLNLENATVRQSVMALRDESGVFDMVLIAPALFSQLDAFSAEGSTWSARPLGSTSASDTSSLEAIRMATDVCYRRAVFAGSLAAELVGADGHIVYVTGTGGRIGRLCYPWRWLENAWQAVRLHAQSERQYGRPLRKHVASITMPIAYLVEPNGLLAMSVMNLSSGTSTSASNVSSGADITSVQREAGTIPTYAFAAPARHTLSKLSRSVVTRILVGEPEVVVPFASAMLLLLQEALPIQVLELARLAPPKASSATFSASAGN